ncbi:MAG TPA: ATP-dependent DNA helicase, partial [Enterococcus aquimarinus]|nr:ATP-dependent DNA helicase [Enterococcus aquimarinus]
NKEQLLQSYFECLRFLKISEFYDDSYETTIEIGRYEITIKQFCIDPSAFLEETLQKGKSSLLFSASLSPIDYYQQRLGGGEES